MYIYTYMRHMHANCFAQICTQYCETCSGTAPHDAAVKDARSRKASAMAPMLLALDLVQPFPEKEDVAERPLECKQAEDTLLHGVAVRPGSAVAKR